MNPHVPNINPMTFENLTQIDGPLERHIEQLWDEIKKLRERVIELEKRREEIIKTCEEVGHLETWMPEGRTFCFRCGFEDYPEKKIRNK